MKETGNKTNTNTKLKSRVKIIHSYQNAQQNIIKINTKSAKNYFFSIIKPFQSIDQ